MNDWHDMDEELKEVQRLDETHVLDSSNINAHGQPARNRRFEEDPDYLLPGAGKELQESSLMTFEDREVQPRQQRLIDAIAEQDGSGLRGLGAVAEVKITDFDWKYEK